MTENTTDSSGKTGIQHSKRKRSAPAGYGSIRAYAASRKRRKLEGGSHTAVRYRIETGVLTPPDPKTGWLEFDRADGEWEQAARPKLPRRGDKSSTDELPKLADGTPDFSELPIGVRYRAESDYWNARRLEQAVKIKRGDLVELTALRKSVHDYYQAIRDRLLGIVPRVQQQLAAESTPSGVAALLEGEIHSALSEPIKLGRQ